MPNDDSYELAWSRSKSQILPFLKFEGEKEERIQLDPNLFVKTSDRTSGHAFRCEILGFRAVGSENPKWGNAVARGFHKYFFLGLRQEIVFKGYRFEFSMGNDFALQMKRTELNL